MKILKIGEVFEILKPEIAYWDDESSAMAAMTLCQ